MTFVWLCICTIAFVNVFRLSQIYYVFFRFITCISPTESGFCRTNCFCARSKRKKIIRIHGQNFVKVSYHPKYNVANSYKLLHKRLLHVQKYLNSGINNLCTNSSKWIQTLQTINRNALKNIFSSAMHYFVKVLNISGL